MTDIITFQPDDGQHDEHVEALYAKAFGPGRFAKAAARLREGNHYVRGQSFLAFAGGHLVGACRLWPIQSGNGESALFLGPIAVDQTVRHGGLGQRLVEACLLTAPNATIILVGDMAFFGRNGFEIVPPYTLQMPGPVDPNRLLWRQGATKPQGRLSVPRATIQIG